MHYLPVIPWIALGLVWAIGALFTNKTVDRESTFSRLSYSLPLGLIAWFLYRPETSQLFPFLIDRVFPENQAVWWIGLAIETAGVAFAIWARFTLGKLWSGTITFKEGHRLVQSGPFAITRHPIYTGALVAVLGTALNHGNVRDLIVPAILILGFSMKISKEEKLMAEHFGDEHRDYRARVRRLIPFVW